MKKSILWVDGIGAITVGTLVLIINDWLSKLYGLPQKFVIFMGIVNIAYGLYSTPLAIRKRRSKRSLKVLVIANSTWSLLCFLFAVRFMKVISVFGLLHLVGEGIYVGGLAYLEWRWKKYLVVE